MMGMVDLVVDLAELVGKDKVVVVEFGKGMELAEEEIGIAVVVEGIVVVDMDMVELVVVGKDSLVDIEVDLVGLFV